MIGFARFTQFHTLLAMKLTPCAEHLYQWLLQRFPAGKTQEIDLRDYIEFSQEGRERPYCFRSVKDALMALVEAGHVQVVTRYNPRQWKIKALHPEAAGKDLSKGTKRSTKNLQTVSKVDPENPDPVVAHNREFIEETDTLPEVNKGMLSEIAAMGISVNAGVQKIVSQADPITVKGAIKMVAERLKKGDIRNPAGFLVQAIKKRWGVPKVETSESSKFNEWYKLEQKAGNVVGSQVIDGQIWVYDKNLKASPWQAPEDLSTILAEIDCLQMARGLTKEALEASLSKNFGVRSRAELSDSDLKVFRSLLATGDI